MALHLVLGNKRYSSWSLRAWLILAMNDLPFTEERIRLYQDNYKQVLEDKSDGGQVPVLQDGNITIFDSLSIAEYLHENYSLNYGWPKDKAARAHARSICALMHSGFAHLRRECPMNIARLPSSVPISEDCQLDIQRIDTLLSKTLRTHGGPFLYGEASIADAYYAPVIIRLDRYALLGPLHSELRAYTARILTLPALQPWLEAGRRETDIIAKAER
ncbi:MAG: glutathione S-transferase family protein [Pseudomonadales bacterium]|nr:glutathione S-transferase family protein [Pseudomonadales bacterium]